MIVQTSYLPLEQAVRADNFVKDVPPNMGVYGRQRIIMLKIAYC